MGGLFAPVGLFVQLAWPLSVLMRILSYIPTDLFSGLYQKFMSYEPRFSNRGLTCSAVRRPSVQRVPSHCLNDALPLLVPCPERLQIGGKEGGKWLSPLGRCMPIEAHTDGIGASAPHALRSPIPMPPL